MAGVGDRARRGLLGIPLALGLAVSAAVLVGPGVAGADDYSYPLQGNFVKFANTGTQVQAHQVSSSCAKLQNNNSKAINSGKSQIFGATRLQGYEVDLGKITMETGGSCGTASSKIKVEVKSGNSVIATLTINQNDIFGVPIRGSFRAKCDASDPYECVSNGIVDGNFELYIRHHH